MSTTCYKAAIVSSAKSVLTIPAAQQEGLPSNFAGSFEANSATAMSITGNVTLTATSITTAKHTFLLASVQPLSTDEAATINSFSLVNGTAAQSFMARVHVPANTAMLGKNTLCGKEDVMWIAGLATSSRTMGLIMFSGATRPVLTKDALDASHAVCGTYGYSRK